MTSKKNAQQNILRFSLSGRGKYGINVLKIREIVPFKELNQLPGAKQGVAGLIELRGNSIQVIDLSAVIGQPALLTGDDQEASIIITEFNRTMQGLLVKQVDKIATIDWESVKGLPSATGSSHYLSGVINIDKEIIGIIDVEKVLYELTPQMNFEQQVHEEIASITDKRILAIDDSRLARSMISKTLDSIGADYIMAASGEDALEILASDEVNIDMIISDIEMPVLDGYALTRQLRTMEKTKDCYILLHSSLSGSACNTMSEQSGADAFLTKFVDEELVKAITIGLAIDATTV